MKRKIFYILLLFSALLSAQESPSPHLFAFYADGYIKYLNSLNFHDADDLLTDNLIHHRINLRLSIGDHIDIHTGIRQRIFYGDMIKNDFFREFISTDKGVVRLSGNIIDSPNILWNLQTDRLNISYTAGKVEFTAGRQRINWGKNLVWNPNDLFNSANFLDFDYEEKPGTDALRIRYDTDNMSQWDLVYSVSDKDFRSEHAIWALAFHSFYKSLDYQLITGLYHDEYVIGGGWETHLGNFGFKGEASYFTRKQSHTFNSSISLDYAFRQGINWLISGLYNGGFSRNELSDPQLLLLSPTDVKNPFPSTWAFYNRFSGDFGPAWQWSLGTMYAVENKLFILIPGIVYQISDNWETDITGQSFFADLPGISQRNIVYFRLRYSF